MAEGLVALEVDGAVFPDGGGAGREGDGVLIVRLGVGGQINPLAVAAVHLDFEGGEAEFLPLHFLQAATGEDDLEDGLGGLGVGFGFLRALNAGVLAIGGGVGGVAFDTVDEAGDPR